MKRLVGLVALAATQCNPYYDSWDYSTEVARLASAEMRCPAEQLTVTAVPDRYGTHTYVADGCGCIITYQCDNHDLNGCSRADNGRLLEVGDASCHP
jgi:hypothetical protein